LLQYPPLKMPHPKNGFGFLQISSSVNNGRVDHCF
jgi:hypothetical protein